MKHLLLVILLLLPLAAGAASYSWTDPAGTVHFTDDLGSVPAKYRAKALRQAAGDETIPDAQPAAAKNDSKTAAAPAGAVPQAGSAQGTATPSTRFGDRSAAEWQQQFQALRAQMKTIEQQMEQLKQEGGDGKKLLGREKIAELNSRSRQLNQEYDKVRLQINQLVEQANKVGLPPEYGQ
jgi:DNA repair exonuclease SbcCD ATPase subunit